MFIFAEKKTVERLSIDIIGGTSKISVNIDHSWSKNTVAWGPQALLLKRREEPRSPARTQKSWSMYRVAQK